nr:C4-dicarboxylate ABC transporter substrate-binding protein [Pseudomonas sp.]
MRYAGKLLAMVPALAAGLAISFSAEARDLRYATGYPPNSIGADAAEVYADAVKKYSDGKLGVKVYPLSLLNFLETAPGIRDGITDTGFVLLPYYPNEFPSSN